MSIHLRPLAPWLGLWLASMGCAHAATPTLATAIPDPTRPPAVWVDSQNPDAKSRASAPPPRATVILRGRERQIAVVDGEPLRVGDRLGDARLVRIEAGRLVFNNGDALDMNSGTQLRPTGKRP